MDSGQLSAKRESETGFLRETAFALVGGLAIGAMLLASIRFLGLDGVDGRSSLIFFRLAAVGEPIGLLVFLVFAAAIVRLSYNAAGPSERALAPALNTGETVNRLLVGSVVLSIVCASALACYVDPLTGFSMDEFVVKAQARAFRGGNVLLDVPPLWQRYSDTIRPVFMLPTADATSWVSGYLPGYSLLLVPFEALGRTWLLNPVLNAVSLICLYGVARQRWPQEHGRHIVAIVSLALSSQFLLTGASGYSMPAHLACNLGWLLAFGAKGRWQLLSGPIGFVASCLHQPVPHALFAAPFLIRALRERRWMLLCWLSLWYAAALYVLLQWSSIMVGRLPTWGPDGVLWLPSSASAFTLFINGLLLVTWQTPASAIALAYALRNIRRITDFDRDLLAGIALCLCFYLFFRLVTQGHGWGWRYGHQMLGNVALLSASVWPRLASSFGSHRAKQIAFASALLTLLVQFPARAWQMNHFASPFARAHRWLRTLPADVVLVPTDSIWYGRDLIRNEPPFRAPVLMHSSLAPSDASLGQSLGVHIRVRRVSSSELTALGLERVKVSSNPPLSVWCETRSLA